MDKILRIYLSAKRPYIHQIYTSHTLNIQLQYDTLKHRVFQNLTVYDVVVYDVYMTVEIFRPRHDY